MIFSKEAFSRAFLLAIEFSSRSAKKLGISCTMGIKLLVLGSSPSALLSESKVKGLYRQLRGGQGGEFKLSSRFTCEI